MNARANIALGLFPRNGAYGIVMRGVQKMHTGCSSLRCRNAAPLRRIKLDTATDQACGTGGMLSTSYNFIKRYNPTADVRLFGQEINPESYAICLAEMMIKGQNAENICYQDTMKADRFKGTKMRFVIENPPFGTPWGGKDAAEGVEDAVNAEYQKGFDGRWGAGLPGSGDMQMLFLQSAIDKMDDNVGRAAIIENGSPLFSGGTASGESQIRRWMLESDLIEAIIALPTDLFYNTGIATYIWVLSKVIALPWKMLCANFILPYGENHYGFFLRCPTSLCNQP